MRDFVVVHPDRAVSEAVKRAARWFAWRNPELDPDEIMGEAALIGVEADRAFDGRGSRAAFTGWMVRRRLAKLTITNETWRRRLLRKQYHSLLHPEAIPAPAGVPDLYTILEECTQDARLVIRKCVAENVRTAGILFGVLRALGWNADRILRVFAEIRESLP